MLKATKVKIDSTFFGLTSEGLDSEVFLEEHLFNAPDSTSSSSNFGLFIDREELLRCCDSNGEGVDDEILCIELSVDCLLTLLTDEYPSESLRNSTLGEVNGVMGTGLAAAETLVDTFGVTTLDNDGVANFGLPLIVSIFKEPCCSAIIIIIILFSKKTKNNIMSK